MSRWHVRLRTVPKHGAPDGLNQDACSFRIERPPHGGLRLLAAVSDGATSAYQAADWSRLLVTAAVSGRIRPGATNAQLQHTFNTLAQEWATANPPRSSEWFHRAHASGGSFATLAMLHAVRRRGATEWRAMVIGDSVLFVLDASHRIADVFPKIRADDLDADPILVSTKEIANRGWTRGRLRSHGRIAGDYSLVLATDAVARWALRQHERGVDAWAVARGRSTTARAFAELVGELRSRGEMNNDDSTFVWVTRS